MNICKMWIILLFVVLTLSTEAYGKTLYNDAAHISQNTRIKRQFNNDDSIFFEDPDIDLRDQERRQENNWGRFRPLSTPQRPRKPLQDDIYDLFYPNLPQNRQPIVSTQRPLNSNAEPGEGTTPASICESRCPTTSQYNPVCGDNNVTYSNISRLNCAVRCGKKVRIAAYRACSRFTSVTV
ncbi:uncharacterized protein LOC126745129 [Anthonomus grandis grandis]|uniref:uncharacterized protein LOC126745129 n=1 Tax=Anthonomus grandis grandis TaxID=2921223 RepID=UPI0021668B35|nr:uncharacterized protein LOC126745129 [Anthonomus grandis grandis]XP_050308810.1 uncharacterized protein LOC126745129 [Anthonomus grandis grandis]